MDGKRLRCNKLQYVMFKCSMPSLFPVAGGRWSSVSDPNEVFVPSSTRT